MVYTSKHITFAYKFTIGLEVYYYVAFTPLNVKVLT